MKVKVLKVKVHMVKSLNYRSIIQAYDKDTLYIIKRLINRHGQVVSVILYKPKEGQPILKNPCYWFEGCLVPTTWFKTL